MVRRTVKMIITVAILVLGGAVGLAAQEIRAESRIDWENNYFTVDLTAAYDAATARGAADLYRAQQRIEQAFSGALFSALLPMPLDSRRVIEDAVREDPDLASRIADLANRAERGLPRPREDLRGITRTYRLPLFPDVTSLFVNHTVPFQMERVVRWVPTRDYSGIVIYAAEPLPLHGTDEPGRPAQTAYLVPALFPQIFDTNLRPVLEQDMVDPAAIERWGVVHYTDRTDPSSWRERAGAQPLRIMARRAYGIIPTDLMISPHDADRILASDHNRQLLRNGRVVVIVDSSRIDQLQ